MKKNALILVLFRHFGFLIMVTAWLIIELFFSAKLGVFGFGISCFLTGYATKNLLDK